MRVFDEIENLVLRTNNSVLQKTRRKKIRLYTEGLKSKMRQTEYSLSQLVSFSNMTDESTTTTSPSAYQTSEKVGFYCDTFWAFLYSSLDVLGQILNQSLKLGMKEKDVSFKQVASKLASTSHNGTPLQQKVSSCLKSNAFRNLDSYRNCSTHRRQIYIKEEIRMVRHTAGYSTTATGEVSSVTRVICENPLDVTPRTIQNRRIPEYMQLTQTKVVTHIEAILKTISPIS
jgi:hypothetical protein